MNWSELWPGGAPYKLIFRSDDAKTIDEFLVNVPNFIGGSSHVLDTGKQVVLDGGLGMRVISTFRADAAGPLTGVSGAGNVWTVPSGAYLTAASGSVVSFLQTVRVVGLNNAGSAIAVTDDITAAGRAISSATYASSGAMSCGGALTVTGATTHTGLVTCNGGLTVASGTLTCGTFHSTGNATVDGTLVVSTAANLTGSVNTFGTSNNFTIADVGTLNRTGPEIPVGAAAYRGDRAAVNAPLGSATVQGDDQECLRLAVPTTAGADITTTITGRTKPGFLLVTRLQNGGFAGKVTIALAGTGSVTSIGFKEGALQPGFVLLYWDGTDYTIVSMSTGNPLTTPLSDVFTIP